MTSSVTNNSSISIKNEELLGFSREIATKNNDVILAYKYAVTDESGKVNKLYKFKKERMRVVEDQLTKKQYGMTAMQYPFLFYRELITEALPDSLRKVQSSHPTGSSVEIQVEGKGKVKLHEHSVKDDTGAESKLYQFDETRPMEEVEDAASGRRYLPLMLVDSRSGSQGAVQFFKKIQKKTARSTEKVNPVQEAYRAVVSPEITRQPEIEKPKQFSERLRIRDVFLYTLFNDDKLSFLSNNDKYKLLYFFDCAMRLRYPQENFTASVKDTPEFFLHTSKILSVLEPLVPKLAPTS